jgi:HSP20 family protein
VDVIDRDNEIVVKAEVPGVKKEDIKVSITDHTLTIRGATEAKKEEKRENYYFSELSKGEFARTLTLPEEVDTSGASAKVVDGMLEITLPKRESAKRHAVDVKIG